MWGSGSGKGDSYRLNRGQKMPKLEVMRTRILTGFILGIAGICLGILGAVLSVSWLTIAAAICAVAGCFVIAGIAMFPLLHSHNDELEDRIQAVMTPRKESGPSSEENESVIDPVTELPDGRYFEVAVEGRVAAARRHLWPVSIVLLQLGFDPQAESEKTRNLSLTSFAKLMSETLREADIACRLDDTTFGLILEDTSEEGGVWTAERIQIALSHDVTSIRRLVAGVAAYPTHGLQAKDVLVRAQAALARASSTPMGHGLGQVEVAHVDL